MPGMDQDVTPGSSNMVIIEGNTFTFNISGNPAYFDGTSAIQSYYGARTVFRYNTCNNCQIDQHGTPAIIGLRRREIYENTFVLGQNACQSTTVVLRAGSGVVFNNHLVGSNHDCAAVSIELYEQDFLWLPGFVSDR